MGFANCVVEVQNDFLADLHQYPFAHYALAYHLQFGEAFAHVSQAFGREHEVCGWQLSVY